MSGHTAQPRSVDWIVFIVAWLVASAIRLLVWTFTASDCGGPGAPYPGGCPAFSQGQDLQTLVFVAGGFVLLVLIQLMFMLLRPRSLYRWLTLLLYAVLLIVGPFFLLVPPPKA